MTIRTELEVIHRECPRGESPLDGLMGKLAERPLPPNDVGLVVGRAIATCYCRYDFNIEPGFGQSATEQLSKWTAIELCGLRHEVRISKSNVNGVA